MKLISIYSFIIFFFSSSLGVAQENSPSLGETLGASLQESGKIYVVVGVIAIIFIGIVYYLIRLDKKISKLEE